MRRSVFRIQTPSPIESSSSNLPRGSGRSSSRSSSINAGAAIFRNRAIIGHIMDYVGDAGLDEDDANEVESLLRPDSTVTSRSRTGTFGRRTSTSLISKGKSTINSKGKSTINSSKKSAPPIPRPAPIPKKVSSQQSATSRNTKPSVSVKSSKAVPPPPAPAPPVKVKGKAVKTVKPRRNTNDTASSIDSSMHSSALSSSKRSLRSSPASVMDLQIVAPTVPTAPDTPTHLRKEEEKQEIASATALVPFQQEPTPPAPSENTAAAAQPSTALVPVESTQPAQEDTASPKKKEEESKTKKKRRSKRGSSNDAVFSYASSSSSSSTSSSVPPPPPPPPPPEVPRIQQSASTLPPATQLTPAPGEETSWEEWEEVVIEEIVSGDAEDSIQKHPVIVTSPGGGISDDSELTFGTAIFSPASSNQKRRISKTSSRESVLSPGGTGGSPGIVYEVIEEVDETDNKGSSPESDGKKKKQKNDCKPLVADDQETIVQEVRFANPHVVDKLEYRQDLDSPLSVNIAHHIPPDHDPYFVPWYEQYYEELPWWEQPDLDEDDAVTALCKKVLMASEDFDSNWQRLEERAMRVEAHVINFALKLKNKRALRMMQEQQQQQKQQPQQKATPPPPTRTPRPAKLTPSKSTSSLISGPESVLDSSVGSSSSERRHSRQHAFQAQQGMASMQNIPKQARRHQSIQQSTTSSPVVIIEEEPSPLPVESSHTLSMHDSRTSWSWSFVDSGAIPKSSIRSQARSMTKLRHVQSQPTPRTQARINPSSAHSQRHSIASMPRQQQQQQQQARPPRTTTPLPFSGRLTPTDEIPQYAQQWQQQPQQGHPQRHSISVTPTRQQRRSPATPPVSNTKAFHQSFVSEQQHESPLFMVDIQEEDDLDDVIDPRPIYDRVATPSVSISKGGGSRVNSRSSLVYSIGMDESSKSQYSVPFDEDPAYSKEIFQDELYYESLRQSGKKRSKPRKIAGSTRSKDPPAVAASTAPLREVPPPLHETISKQAPDPHPMISNVEFPRRSPLQRHLSNVSELSDVDYGPIPGQTPMYPESVKRTPSFPPPALRAKIEQAEKQQQELSQNPTEIPEYAKADIEELMLQANRYSVAASTSEDTFTLEDSFYTIDEEDDALSQWSRSSFGRGRKRPSTPAERLSLRKSERQRLNKMSSRDESSKGGRKDDPGRYQSLPQQEQAKAAPQDGKIQMIGVICLVLLLVAILAVAIWIGLTLRDISANAEPQGDGGNATAPTTAPRGNLTQMPQSTPLPTAAPVPLAPLDGATLLPSWSWQTVQQDSNSPQAKAWEWLDNSNTQGYSDERLQQRYAIATFYFATSGDTNTAVQARQGGGNGTDVSYVGSEDDPTEDDVVGNEEQVDQGWLNPDTSECTWNEAITCNAAEQVDSFFFRSSNLVGTVPDEMGMLTNLLSIDLGSNPGLQGVIPSRLGLVTTLLGLDLHSCDFTGSIPGELGTMTDLLWLTLANQLGNKLSSTIPTELALLTNLEHLRLEGNSLTGSIPVALESIPGLLTMLLSNNQLTGSIPPEVSRLVKLKVLALDSNSITGPIPDEVGRMTSLMELHLGSNRLQSRLPAAFNQLSNTLTTISLQDNLIQGPLPTAWEALSKLQLLELNNNAEITGVIPDTWGLQWPDLQRISLQATQLTGIVPVSLCFLKDDPLLYSLETIEISCDSVACTCDCICA